ncbi:UNVERIFIED_CONTAM: hypothetical protein Sradi_2503500 [Sesamum radiatum]|uniref:Reverse transcriptase domain-containing protein n=1 Tax=Sesamum radiatum TaxID=300843 RepID=A0AAW2SK44_SESRA
MNGIGFDCEGRSGGLACFGINLFHAPLEAFPRIISIYECPGTIFERLDRACSSRGWFSLFPNVKHGSNELIAKKLVNDAWNQLGGESAQNTLEIHFAHCKSKFQASGHTGYKYYQEEIKKLEKALLVVRKQVVKPENKIHKHRLRNELEATLQSEETFWEQRCKNHWLKEGDRNMSFFHKHASRTFRRNSISRLKDSDGNWIEKVADIKNHITQHFSRVFNSKNQSDNDLERGVEAMMEMVDSDMNSELLKPYSAEETVDAISHMASLKSPGLNGLPPIFFHKFWHIIKNDVINSVLSILNDRSLESYLNFTHIVLIPKCNKPNAISQFRPISLCDVVMKIATKCIANRLKPILDLIISPTQSAFIPSRLISDNILIAFEINHFFKNKTWGNSGHMAIKLDISKAYDKIEWSFLWQMRLLLLYPRPSIVETFGVFKSVKELRALYICSLPMIH